VTAELGIALPVLLRATAAAAASAKAANDAQSIGYAIDVVEPRRDQGDLQNTAIVEADSSELCVIVWRNFRGVLGQLHSVIEHCAILFADWRRSVIALQRIH
jgi:hypothetical protein